MKWKGQSRQEQRVWHTVFAFVPHHAETGEWLWLERVERRMLDRTALGGPVWIWLALVDG